MINAERWTQGMGTVARNRRLYRAARHHNWEMQYRIHHISHSSANGDRSPTRIRRFGYARGASRWYTGEIIAEGWGRGETPARLMLGWLKSPPHSRIIHTPYYQEFGVAAARGIAETPRAYGALVTVDFGARY
jgi:uncharacterized protein YkwD